MNNGGHNNLGMSQAPVSHQTMYMQSNPQIQAQHYNNNINNTILTNEHDIQQPEQAQKKKANKPKQNIMIRPYTIEQHVVKCHLNRSFFSKKMLIEKKFSKKFNINLYFTDKAMMELATILKLRMTYITKECVWYAKQRKGQLLPANERVIIDIPRIKFSMIEAERRILLSRKLPNKDNYIKGLNGDMDKIKNEIVLGLAVQSTGNDREKISELIIENESQDKTQNLANLADVTNKFIQTKDVVIEDIDAFMQNDSVLFPSQTLRRNFFIQKYKIGKKS